MAINIFVDFYLELIRKLVCRTVRYANPARPECEAELCETELIEGCGVYTHHERHKNIFDQ
jgi:hypothetical protein